MDVIELLKRHHLDPKQSLGQNFLIVKSELQKVVAAAELTRHDSVLEIGAGVGNLTILLARSAGMVTAVEIDQRFLPILHEQLTPHPKVRIVHGDILKIPPEELAMPDGYAVVANIPYFITSAIIRRLLETGAKPSRMVLTMQKEVAQRICAKPGDLSLLALSVQVYGAPRVVETIPASAFHPAPEVDSAILRVDLFDKPVISTDQLPLFFRLAKAGFHQKRKTLRNSLTAGMARDRASVEKALEACDIDPMRRAETLSLHEWGQLTKEWNSLST